MEDVDFAVLFFVILGREWAGHGPFEDPWIQKAQIYAALSGSPGQRPRLRKVAPLPEDDNSKLFFRVAQIGLKSFPL